MLQSSGTGTCWESSSFHGLRPDQAGLVGAGPRHLMVADGTWLQPEPKLVDGTMLDLSRPRTFAPCRYGANNPVFYNDRTGHFPQALVAVAGAIGVAADTLGLAADVHSVATDVQHLYTVSNDDNATPEQVSQAQYQLMKDAGLTAVGIIRPSDAGARRRARPRHRQGIRQGIASSRVSVEDLTLQCRSVHAAVQHEHVASLRHDDHLRA